MPIGSLTLTLHLPGIASLKGKRSVIKPMLMRLRKEFNVSAAEIGLQDHWQDAQIQIVAVGENARIMDASMQEIYHFFQINWPEIVIANESFEII